MSMKTPLALIGALAVGFGLGAAATVLRDHVILVDISDLPGPEAKEKDCTCTGEAGPEDFAN